MLVARKKERKNYSQGVLCEKVIIGCVSNAISNKDSESRRGEVNLVKDGATRPHHP